MTPRIIIILSAIFSLTFATCFFLLTYTTPWLGINFSIEKNSHGLIIDSLERTGPTYNLLSPGILITEIGNQQQSVKLTSQQIIPEPADLPTFADYNHFVANNKKIFEILSSDNVWLKDNNKQIYLIKPEPHRDIYSLKAGHIANLVIGVLSFVFYISIIGFKKGSMSAWILSVSATAFTFNIIIGQTSFFRELVINPLILEYAHPFQILAALVFAYFLLGLLLYYPSRLASKKIIYVLICAPLLFWLNIITQQVELVESIYLIHFNILFITLFFVSFLQWRKARGMAIEMAQFKWLFLFMATGAGLNISLNILPLSLGYSPFVSFPFVLFFSNLIFIGIAIGIYQYKLFNIDKWWFSIWNWFFAGLIIILLDIALVTLLQLNENTASFISILIVGWIYFPIRQQLWKHFTHREEITLSKYIPEIIRSISAIDSPSEINSVFMATLKKLFNVQNISETDILTVEPCIQKSGLSLQLPGIDNNTSVLLEYPENGSRLFTYDDIKLISGITDLFSHTYQALKYKQQGVNEERERIMSDLHDDLGPKLLSLIHGIKKPSLAEVASDSLHTLRDIVYSMRNEEAMTLSELLADERYALAERAAEKDKTILWNISSDVEGIYLKSESVLQIKRILNEIISNELRHGTSNQIKIECTYKNNIVNLKCCSKNTATISDWKQGTGLSNLCRRSRLLRGSINWYIEKSDNLPAICFDLKFPYK
ncbi:MAG: hypothetical protein OEY29_14265 [Gammaproteobacteria bacterium]|nr:hypothetical protein [Gammaproteobacteria bacterium]